MILTPAQFREHVETAVEDDALKRLLDAAEATIIEVAGDGAEITELVEGGYGRVVLSRPAASIVSVREGGTTWTTLNGDSYSMVGSSVLRRALGYRWSRYVEVTYIPANEAALRMQVQIRLVELDLNKPAGVQQNTVGPFNEQLVAEYDTERQRILAPLRHSPGVTVL